MGSSPRVLGTWAVEVEVGAESRNHIRTSTACAKLNSRYFPRRNLHEFFKAAGHFTPEKVVKGVLVGVQ